MNSGLVYASALYELAREASAEKVIGNELTEIKRCFTEMPEYVRLLNAANIHVGERIRLVRNAFGSAHPYVRNLLEMLVRKRETALFVPCAAEYEIIYKRFAGIADARLYIPFAISAESIEKIRSKLCELSGKNVNIEVEIDEGLIGGMRLEMDGRCFDNSLQTKIRRIHEHMKGEKLGD